MFRILHRCLIGCAVALAGASVFGAPHKVRVSDPAVAKSLIDAGGRLVADYNSFQIIEADDALLVGDVPGRASLADGMNIIRLNARPLDTRTPAIQSLRRPVAPFAGRRLHLIQFAGPMKPDWMEALERSGVRVITYIPENAYLVYGDVAALAQMQAWAQTADYVQWEGDYAGEYKIHPRARATDATGNPQNPGTDTFSVQLVDDAAANAASLAVIDQLRLAPIRKQFRALNYLNLIVRLPADRLDELAAQPEVVSILPYFEPRKRDERQDQIAAGNLSGALPSGPGYLQWLADKGFSQAQFDASGFAVDVSDSGIDNGTTAPGHFALYKFGNPTQGSRVAYSRLEGTPNNPGSTLSGCDGHGTLNTHIIAGYSDLAAGFPHTDSAGYHYGLGICPFVKVGASVIFDPDVFTSPDYENLQSEAYHDGARISGNSWGASNGGLYDSDAQRYDALARDAQPAGSTFPVSGNQAMVLVFAAGNAGPTSQSLDSPASAKNVITVGAAENVRSISTANGGNTSSGTDGCGTTDTDANSANDMTDFSSRGPCADGRKKPDLVAPGTHITGGVGQAGSPTTNGTGSAIGCFDSSGVCALPGSGTPGSSSNFFPVAQQFYTVSSGSSHSTPAVAGACALVRQDFINHGRTPASPAMTKACLVNSTRYMSGAFANDTLWSAAQGMGELNLGTAFDGVPRVLRDQEAADKFTATGQTRTFAGTITDPTKPFRVTLAWTDAPGPTSGSAWKNDLDLTVTVGGNTYKGNVFSGAFSITGGAADGENNVESVFLPAGLSGNFTLTVSAANINSDGVPNEAPTLDQDFALVIYNAASIPVVSLEASTLTAENCFPTNGVIDPGENVTVAFSLRNIGSADTTNLVVTLMETNGIVSPSGPQAYGVITAGGSAVTQAFSFTATGSCGGAINPVLQLQDGAADFGTVTAQLPLGVRNIAVHTITNSAMIKIPANGTSGKASPYPSSIIISGITGTVSQVTVTFVGVTHTFPDDIDALLAGPGGQTVLLMSDCGSAVGRPNPITGLTLTFDDNAINPLPDSSQITAGTYKPTDYDTTTDNFPSPAPSGPFGQTLSQFNGLDPNGTWSLYVQDDLSGDTGSISQGWRVSITTSDAVCCAGSVNHAPVLMQPPDFTIVEGQLLSFTNVATDIDVPTQALTFSLSNAPVGASIIATNGIFSWTPGNAYQSTTNSIAVSVTDNGVPPLSDTKSFSVAVLPPPSIQSIILSNGLVKITWSAISGQSYRVQFKEHLTDAVWTDAVPDVIAGGSSASWSDTLSSTQRYYRIQVR